MHQKGFVQIILLGFVAALVLVGTGKFFLFPGEKIPFPDKKTQIPNPELSQINASTSKPIATKGSTPAPKSVVSQTPSQTVLKTNSDEPPLLLKSIGVNLDYYDPASNRAGDFVFTKQKLQFDRLFMSYGFFIPSSEATREKYNPQPTFILPLGTPARSLVDGIVVSIPTLWSGDYSVQVTANGKMEKWIYETEHIINPRVKVGDKVTAGQIIGEVSDFSQGTPTGFGMVEIGILKGGQVPQHVCPFAYLDPSIKQEMEKKIIALYKAWEEYVDNSTLYDESASNHSCLILDPIDG